MSDPRDDTDLLAKVTAHIGQVLVETGSMLTRERRQDDIPGWLFASSTGLYFHSHVPLSGAILGLPEALDDSTIVIQFRGNPFSLDAPLLLPNGILTFQNGLGFIGRKKQMKAITAIAQA